MPHTTSLPRLGYQLVSTHHSKPPLVFVCGMGGVQAAFLLASRYFSASRPVLTYDHRWIGLSSGLDTEQVPEGGMSMQDYAADLVRLLDETGLEQADFVGLSFGGRVLQELALGWPERVRRLVIGGSSAGGRGHTPGDETAIRALRQSASLSEREWLELVIPAMFGERYRSEEPSRVQNLARWWARHPPNAFGLEQQGIAYDCFDCSERLAQLKKPVLLLYGTEDRLSPPANAMFLLQNLPDARLVWLEQVGHSPNAEASERFHAEIEHFTE